MAVVKKVIGVLSDEDERWVDFPDNLIKDHVKIIKTIYNQVQYTLRKRNQDNTAQKPDKQPINSVRLSASSETLMEDPKTGRL